MATFLLASVLVHTPPSSSDLIANDVVDIYWNDSTSQFNTNKNSISWAGSAGGYFGEITTNYHVSGITSYDGEYAVAGYSFCSSTTLKWFRMPTLFATYPYMEAMSTANSPVCAAGGGVVCDIAWSGPRVGTNSTSLSSPNGVMTSLATSSNGTVKYSLNDFDYATGGQTSGTFSGLAPGYYSLYAKDANSCTLYITFSILYEPVESEHYRFTWDSIQISAGTSREARVRIYEREYVGDMVEVGYSDPSPFKLYKPKQGDINDKFFPVHPVNATLFLKSQQDYQFLPLFTQDNKKYRCVYEVDEGSGFTAIWSGFIVPSVYREDFIATPYTVEIQISDNVKTLDKELFTDINGNLLFGQMSLIKIIAHIMKKTGLDLGIRSGINIFEVTHTTAATDDPLAQTFVDVSCYRTGADPFTCWDVLEKILRPFGARIFQYDNQWIIEEIDRAVATYAYRVFDLNGVYVSNSTFNPIIDVKDASLTSRAALIDRNHSLEVIPAYGKIEIVSKLNYIGSIVAGGFEKEDLLSPESETFNTLLGVYTSEEGFNGWTLRLNGTSGVSFGRVVVGRRGEGGRAGLDEKDPDRSVGAFFFNSSAYGGNLRNAYIESSAKAYQYSSGSELRFFFEYSTPARPEYEFMVLRFMIKVGSTYLQQDLQWSASEYIYRAYPPVSNSLQNFELSIPLPSTNVVVDTTVQVRVYFYAKDFFDYGEPSQTSNAIDGTDGVAGLKALSTTSLENDYRVDIRQEVTIGVFTNAFRSFRELRRAVAAEDLAFGVIQANDYNATTNPKIWWPLKAVLENEGINGRTRGIDKKFYIDNIGMDALINGQPPPLEETITLNISQFINENLEIELYNFDLPDDITNAKNMYNNYFRLSSGSPTTLWARSGITEALTLQEILLKVLGGNHSAPTFRLTGSFVNEFARIGINNYLRITKAGSSLSVSNTEFTTNLTGWTQTGSGTAFAYTASNSGSAEVVLAGVNSSQKIYQTISHSGGYILNTINVHVEPAASNDREDIMWIIFWNGTSITHTEKLKTFAAVSSSSDYSFTYTAFVPGEVTRVGFYFQRLNGAGTCTYQVGQFKPEGTDIQEVYQIADYQQDERQNTYVFELMQISKTYVSLQGVDQGGNNQGGSTTGRAHSSAYSSAYS